MFLIALAVFIGGFSIGLGVQKGLEGIASAIRAYPHIQAKVKEGR